MVLDKPVAKNGREKVEDQDTQKLRKIMNNEISGTRAYSINEIEEQIREGFSENFVAYLSRCPENIKQRILKRLDTENDRKQAEARIQRVNFVNPYKEKEFKKRLEVEDVYISVLDDAVCPECGSEIDSIQVVVKRSNAGRIITVNNMIKCCRRCKRLFVNEAEYPELKEFYVSRNIKYIDI